MRLEIRLRPLSQHTHPKDSNRVLKPAFSKLPLNYFFRTCLNHVSNILHSNSISIWKFNLLLISSRESNSNMYYSLPHGVWLFALGCVPPILMNSLLCHWLHVNDEVPSSIGEYLSANRRDISGTKRPSTRYTSRTPGPADSSLMPTPN